MVLGCECQFNGGGDSTYGRIWVFVTVRPEPAEGGGLNLLDGIEHVPRKSVVTPRPVAALNVALCQELGDVKVDVPALLRFLF